MNVQLFNSLLGILARLTGHLNTLPDTGIQLAITILDIFSLFPRRVRLNHNLIILGPIFGLFYTT